MTVERGEMSGGNGAKAGAKAHGFLGSLKDALLAAGREEPPAVPQAPVPAVPQAPAVGASAQKPEPMALPADDSAASGADGQGPSAAEAARLAREAMRPARIAAGPIEAEPPTTRVIRAAAPAAIEAVAPQAPRTQLVRGRQPIARGTFERDPVVGFLVVVGGPGLGSFRPIFEGNNTVGRAAQNRIPLDFGDEAISNDEQAYIRYDSNDRTFLFVPNLAKTNVVSVNEKRPTGAVELNVMDVITLGRTQVAFVPFCGAEFDWSEIADT